MGRKASQSRIGQRVRILPTGGMKEFHGKTGRIVDTEDEYYRVRLDEPVEIEGLGKVADDLWMAMCLKTIRGN